MGTAGSQQTRVGVESVAKAAGIAVLAVICGGIFLGVVDSVLSGRFGAAVSPSQIQYTAISHISTAAVMASVLLVFVRGVETELVAKASGVIYAASFFESILRSLLRSSLGVDPGLFVRPLYSVVTFLGYVVAFYVLFETDIVSG
ncbi:hypothetical protein [Halosimplex salinum]|uniref:hypothetical protein n=1 Tax=Halosimplex salinum TaxID=1710538 RepID=UPI0013DE74A4|nr:hypothetical protein [Halosimplex salinum]